MRKPTESGRPPVARRTTAARRRKEAFRRCGALPEHTKRPQPARHGARAKQARVVHLLPRDSDAVPSSRVPREGQLILSLGGSSWHVAPRPHAEREGPLAGAVPLPSARTDRSQRGTVRAQQQTRMVHLLPRDSERSGAPTRATRQLGDSGWPQLARRTTATHRSREASRRRSALTQARTDHGLRFTARARSKLA